MLTGLYPDTTDPILIETCDDRREWLYPNHRNCKRLSELIAGRRAQLQKKRRAEAYYKGLEAKLREAIEGEGENEYEGMREGDEQCDCGGRDCAEVDPCCDGATCRLKTQALAPEIAMAANKRICHYSWRTDGSTRGHAG